jgi:GNAT superfamily N-acetyltransferase
LSIANALLRKAVPSKSTIEIFDQYWSSSLGCPSEALYNRQTLVVPDAASGNFRGIYCFLRNRTLIVAVSSDLIDAFRLRAESWSREDVLDETRLRRLIDYPIDWIIGPAFIGYTDWTTFRPVSREGVRILKPEDLRALEILQAACDPLEWEHGGSRLGDQSAAGAFDGERLVAVAGYEIWGGSIAHIGVVSHPHYRGKGYGKAVVSKLTKEVLNRGVVPQYQTLDVNKPSMELADRLGFERYATTVAVRLKSSG